MARPHRLRQPTATLKSFRVEERGFDTPCHIFVGPQTPDGYGRITIGGRRRPAHVAAYEHHYGPVPPRHHVHHQCEVRCCINPDHLQAVTPGGHRKYHPANRGNAKLTNTQVNAIRRRRANGEKVKPLMAEYDVSRNTIWLIVTERSYRTV